MTNSSSGKLSIYEAYECYRQITCHYRDTDKVSQIFTEDAIGGNVLCGHIQGLEALSIFYTSAKACGLEPEDHLWRVIEGDTVVFRFRQWVGKKHESAYFGGLGNLVFDPGEGKFRFYHGVFDSAAAMNAMASNPQVPPIAAEQMAAAEAATRRYQSTHSNASGKITADERFTFNSPSRS